MVGVISRNEVEVSNKELETKASSHKLESNLPISKDAFKNIDSILDTS